MMMLHSRLGINLPIDTSDLTHHSFIWVSTWDSQGESPLEALRGVNQHEPDVGLYLSLQVCTYKLCLFLKPDCNQNNLFSEFLKEDRDLFEYTRIAKVMIKDLYIIEMTTQSVSIRIVKSLNQIFIWEQITEWHYYTYFKKRPLCIESERNDVTYPMSLCFWISFWG